MIILGVNSFFEHPAVALIKNGELIFAVEDERLTRIKHGKSYSPYKTYIPFDSIYCALKYCDIHASEIDEISYSYSTVHHRAELKNCFNGKRRSTFGEELAAYHSAQHIKYLLSGKYELPLRYSDYLPAGSLSNAQYTEWDHHLSHAASAFFFSGMDSALIVVSDGSGEKSATSIYVGTKNELIPLASIDLPHSLGLFYADLTKHLGFEPFADEYKVMGLAAYGEDNYKSEMRAILNISSEGYFQYHQAHLDSLGKKIPSRTHGAELTQQHFDLACSVQRRLEECLVSIISYYLKKTGQKNLCVAGGTFLNVLANSKLHDIPDTDNVFIQPAAHDAGTALGAAALSWVASGGSPQIKYSSMFLGPSYDDDAIKKAIHLAGLETVRVSPHKLAAEVAQLLADEHIVAMFRGRMEFGPRALGNRSLLASPKSAKTREKLNILKDREMFRPLAPLITSEYFHDFFDGQPNRYMMTTATARNKTAHLIPAVVHNDGTSRVQTVSREDDAFLHQLLCEFKDRTDIPVLINTSLNVRGKPIDLTPQDAINSFFSSGIDYLVMENYIIRNPNTSTLGKNQ